MARNNWPPAKACGGHDVATVPESGPELRWGQRGTPTAFSVGDAAQTVLRTNTGVSNPLPA